MALPRIVVRGRQVVLLSGFEAEFPERTPGRLQREPVLLIQDEDKLLESAQAEIDAVAFGYVAGRWIAAA
jgi:hypothetical protein